MRQLFLPACVCFVAWSGATNTDPRVGLDEFASVAPVKRETAKPAPKPAHKPAHNLSDEEIAVALAGLAIEAPIPSGAVVNNGENAGIPLPPIPKPVIARTEEEVCGTLTEAAQRNGLPAPFFIRLLFQESRFEPGVVSSAGAQGIAQFMPDTATDMGVKNPFDPLQAIPASARLLRDLFQKFGNLGLAAAAYNAGPKRIADWLADKHKNKLPEETLGYVKTITGKPVENWSEAAARHPGVKLPRHAPCQEAAGLLAWNGPDAVPLPAPAPLKVAAAPAEKGKSEAITGKSEAIRDGNKRLEASKTKAADKSKVTLTEKPKAPLKVAAHKHEPKLERVAQR
jgi:soluble lytic murein transglycosylase-like protein